jgi:NADPH-dependent curcumin reductase CurA
MSDSRRSVILRSRPKGQPTPENFSVETDAIPQPGDGEVLTRTLWLSLDPYMRGRMSDAASYAAPIIGVPISVGAA